MRLLSEANICLNRPYINIKKLTSKISIRKGSVNDAGLKASYIIDPKTNKFCKNNNYTISYVDEIEKMNFTTDALDGMLIVEVNYSARTGAKSGKFKTYVVLNTVKYALPFSSFEDIYKDCMDIISNEITDETELSYIKACFNNLENDEIKVDLELNLKRLSDFKDKVNYKRNIDYFVINNIDTLTSKYDINNKSNKIKVSDKVKVLRYGYSERLYSVVKPYKDSIVELKRNDIICTLGDYKNKENFPTVSIYTEFGLGKLLDVKNNVIPNPNTLSLFANILDLGFDVL